MTVNGSVCPSLRQEVFARSTHRRLLRANLNTTMFPQLLYFPDIKTHSSNSFWRSLTSLLVCLCIKIVLKAYVLAPRRGTPCTWKNCHALPRCSHWKRMKQSLSFSLKGRNGESIGAKLQALMCGLTKSDCKESWSTKKSIA